MSSLTDDAVERAVRTCLMAHEATIDADRARAIATRVVAAAEGDMAPAGRSTGQPRWRRPTLKVTLAALAAVVAAVTLLGAQLLAGRAPATQPGATASLTGDARNKALTETAVAQAMTLVPSLPGSRARTAADAGSVGADLGSGPNGVLDTAYATAPGSVASAVDYLRAHPPAGYAAYRPEDRGAGAQSVSFSPKSAEEAASDAWGGLAVSVTVAPGLDGVVVRRAAFAVWRPARVEATRLPSNAQLVSVVRTTSGGKSKSITIDAALGPRFLARMAELRAEVPIVTLCPGGPYLGDTFTLSGTGGPFVVTASLGCGGGVRVTRAGVEVPQALEGAESLDALVRNLPGTPTG